MSDLKEVATKAGPDAPAERRELYKRLLCARMFEERMTAANAAGQVPGGLMQSIGQEAVGIGIGSARREGDIGRSWVRGISQAIGFGLPLPELCAELFGRAGGVMGGRGGAQFLAWREGGYLGGSGVVGSVLPVAVGHAMGQKLLGDGRPQNVTFCYLGEGALHIGPTHEAMNLAGLWRVPIIFVCEDNGYALSATWSMQTGGPREAATRAKLYGLSPHEVDGNDVEAVARAASQAREEAISGRPVFILAKTYRLAPFSTGETGALGSYVPAGEREAAWEHDPVKRHETALTGEGVLDEEQVAAIRAEVAENIARAVAFAEASPIPDVSRFGEGALA